MKSKLISKEPEIVISFTMQEARWLKGAMQNPINTTPEDEFPDEAVMRKALWEELTIQGV